MPCGRFSGRWEEWQLELYGFMLRYHRALLSRNDHIAEQSGAPNAVTSTSIPSPGPEGAEPKPACDRGS